MSSSSFFGVVVSNATVVKKCRRRRRRRRRRTRRRVFFSLFPRHEIVSFQDRGVVDLVMIGQIESSKKKIRKCCVCSRVATVRGRHRQCEPRGVSVVPRRSTTMNGDDTRDGCEDDDVELNAWGIPVLKYTPDDVVKQKFLETIHAIEYRDRSSFGFRNPDEVEALRLNDADDDKSGALGEFAAMVREIEHAAEVEDTQKAVKPRDEDALVVVDAHRNDKGDGDDDGEDDDDDASSGVGNYFDLLFDGRAVGAEATSEQRVAMLETRLKTMRGVPPHLHAFVKPIALDLPFGSRVKKISGGDDHAIILLESDPAKLETIDPTYVEHEGRVLVLGSDKHGQLGLNTTGSQSIPVALDSIGDAKALDVAAGARHSVLITVANECLTWGMDCDGCSGQGESGANRVHDVPRWMYWITNATTKVIACAAGDKHTAILTTTAQVYTFGSGTLGQLGHGDGTSYTKPKLVEALSKLHVVSIACGSNHTLVVTDDGFGYGFGSNKHGQLGSSDTSNVFIPRRLFHDDLIGGIPDKINVNMTALETLEAERNQLESGIVVSNRDTVGALTKVRHRIMQIAAGKSHTVILSEAGRVYVCGAGASGQLGLQSTEDCQSVTLLATMITVCVVQVAAGDLHTVMLTTLGDVYVCGSNDYGQLGNGSLKATAQPSVIQPIITPMDRLQKKKSEIDELERHPMFKVKGEQVYASKSSTYIVARGGDLLYICGSGAFGHPMNEHPTDLSKLMAQTLDKRHSNQLLVMASTFSNLKLDEHVFQNLVKQMVMYGVYAQHVLAHIFKSALEELLMRSQLCSVYVNMIKLIGEYSAGCSALSFRRVLMFAIEDLGVRLLDARNEAQRRRLLKQLGPVTFQKLLKKDGAMDLQNKFSRTIIDRAGYAEYNRFKADCLCLKRFVRELFEAKVLLEEDIIDMRIGFPGSSHSVSLINSVDAEQKLVLFEGIATLKRPTQVTSSVSSTIGFGETESKTKLPPLLTHAHEDAAWNGGFGALKGNENTWKKYMENVKQEKNIRSVTHAIPTNNKNPICESMLAPSTRNVFSLDGKSARKAQVARPTTK